MTTMKADFWAIFMLIAFGICIGSLPQTTAAQNTRDKQERKVETDDDDDDEELSDTDKATVKISLDAAREIALSKVPGKVIDEELEKEHGRLQYAFDIKTSDGKVFDVEINAVTGEILQAEEDDDDDEDNDGTENRKTKSSKNRIDIKTSKVSRTKPQ